MMRGVVDAGPCEETGTLVPLNKGDGVVVAEGLTALP